MIITLLVMVPVTPVEFIVIFWPFWLVIVYVQVLEARVSPPELEVVAVSRIFCRASSPQDEAAILAFAER